MLAPMRLTTHVNKVHLHDDHPRRLAAHLAEEDGLQAFTEFGTKNKIELIRDSWTAQAVTLRPTPSGYSRKYFRERLKAKVTQTSMVVEVWWAH